MSDVSITVMARNFSDYINRVAYQGERFTIIRSNKPVAQVLPVPQGKTLGDLAQLVAGSATLSPDEAAAFEQDLAAIRRAGNEALPEDPWASS